MALRARSDAHLGPISPHGFRAMFKSRDAIDSVGVILESIYVLKTKSGLKPSPDSQLEPRFACATEDMEGEYDFLNLGYDPWERCLRRSPEGVFPAAFYAEGTAYTFLCPPFNLQAPRPSTSHCPTVDVDTDNRFRGDQNLFAQKYQVYTLLFQLVRFYIGSWALNPYTVPPEQLDWNDCVFKLNSYDSTRNPTNFEIYTARKLLPPFAHSNMAEIVEFPCTVVIQQCTQEPIPPVANNASTPSLTSSSIPNPEAQIHSAPPSGLPLSATPSVVLKPSTAAVEAA